MDLKRLNQLAQITSPPLDYKIVIDKDTDAQSYCMSLSDLKALMIAGVSTIQDAASTTYVNTEDTSNPNTIVMRSSADNNNLIFYNKNDDVILSVFDDNFCISKGSIISLGAFGLISNTAVGESALLASSSGERCTAIGRGALASLTNADDNTAIGYHAGHYISSPGNTAIGAYALFDGYYSYRNVAIGTRALHDQYGHECVAVGYEALENNNYANNNTAIGAYALNNNHGVYGQAQALGNTAVGHNAMRKNVSGKMNTSVGKDSLLNNTTQEKNVAIGYATSSTGAGGYNCTVIGAYANTPGSYDNVTCIGAHSSATGHNQVILGDGAVTDIYAGSSHLHSVSDERDKSDIKTNNLGLNFIEKLQTITYKVNNRKRYRKLQKRQVPNPTFEPGGRKKLIKNKNYSNEIPKFIEREDKLVKNPRYMEEYIKNPNFDFTNEEFILEYMPVQLPNDGTKKGKRPHVGVSAQQVKKVMDELGIDFAGYQDHGLKGEHLSIAYTQFIGPLIKSVQELSAKIKILENK